MSRAASRDTSRESTLQGSSLLSPVSLSSRAGDFSQGSRRRLTRREGGPPSGSPSGSDSGRRAYHGLHFIGFDHPPSDLVQRIVHPLFSAMIEPEAKSRRRGASDLKPRAFRPSLSKGVDPAMAIIELGKDFAELILKTSKDKKTMKSARGLPVEMILAGLSLGFFIAGVEKAPYIELKHVPDIDPGELLETWQIWQRNAKNPQPLRPLDRKGMEFRWIYEDRSPVAHLERLAAAAKSLSHGYVLLRRQHGIPSISKLCNGTELIEDVDLPGAGGDGLPIQLEFAKGDILDIAVEETGKGNKVAVLSMASGYQVGSGFATGGCHHLGAEEALCMQSTLFFSLQRAAVLAEEHGLQDTFGLPVHIPERGAVVSPGVEVFRHGVDTGYAPMQRSTEISAIVSFSMPNKNSSLKDVPLDRREGDGYDQLLADKFQAALTGAARAGARLLVLPMLGCGELQNSPADVGRILGRTLARFNGYFDTLIVVGSHMEDKDQESNLKSHDMYEAIRKWYEANSGSSLSAVAREGFTVEKDLIQPLLKLSHQMLSGTTLSKVTGKTSWAAMGVNPMRSEMTRQLGSELKIAAAAQAAESSKENYSCLVDLLSKYGVGSGKKVPSARLNELLKEWYHGELPPYEELRFITRSTNPKSNMRLIPAREIVESIRAYELYQQFKKDLEIVFYLYDGDGVGQLEESQVVRVLHEMSGEALTLEQVMVIMRHADINYNHGSISRFEFAIMVVRWQSMMANYYAEEPLILPMKGFPYFQISGMRAWHKNVDELCLAACGPAQRTHSIAPVISQEYLDCNSEYRRQFLL